MIDPLLFELNPGLFYTALAIVSLAVGSLLNVIIYRLPQMMQAEFLHECRCQLQLEPFNEERINLFFPRSFCPACRTPITFWYNIPVLGYLLSRARCSHCHQPISIRYPAIEALTCLLSLYAAWHFGFHLSLLFALGFIWIAIVLFFIDLDHHLLPDSLTQPLLWLGLFANSASLFTSLPVAVFSAAGAYLSLWLFIRLYYLLSGKVGMGNGDFKLFAAFGAWFGWTLLPMILLLSSLAGALVGLIYLRMGNQSKDTPIAFGPFLCLAGLFALFWGQRFMNWYLGFLA